MKSTIIIIADDLLFWNLFIPLLEKEFSDIQIRICETYNDIETKINVESCDLIILDGGMSSLSCIEVLQYIRVKKRIVSPVWFFPEIQTDIYIYKAMEMGATRIINKPFDPYLVAEEIISLLNK